MTKLIDLTTDIIVPMRDKPKAFDGDIPWCRIEDVQGKYLNDSLSGQRVSQKTVREMNLRVFPERTVVFTCSATIGVTAITTRPLCTNQTFIGLVPSENLNTDYLYYYLTQIGREFKKAASITTIPYLSRTFFENLNIDVPLVDDQKLISSLLSSIDDKILINTQAISELSSIMRLYYDYWFTQFDYPGTDGRPYKSSGGSMKYSKELKREIPKDWKVENMVDSSQIVDCLHSKKPDFFFESADCYLMQLENIENIGVINNSSKYYVSRAEYDKWTSKIEVREDDLVITNAGRIGAIAQLAKGQKMGIGRNITAIRPLDVSPTYLYLSLTGHDVTKQIRQNTDSGAFFGSLNVKGIKRLSIMRPGKEIEERFETIVRPIRDSRDTLFYQNQELIKLRDWLLPMLMTGQVKIAPRFSRS
jgi:type I restriction enzyme, S subunit